jgi:hypothetical protein
VFVFVGAHAHPQFSHACPHAAMVVALPHVDRHVKIAGVKMVAPRMWTGM